MMSWTTALSAATLAAGRRTTLTLRDLLLISAEPDREGRRKHEDCCDYESNSTHLLTWKKLRGSILPERDRFGALKWFTAAMPSGTIF